ncbi:MAG: cyclic nucleotide-binding domain-containing protein [Desulfobacterales bacterium]|nr:cyclic nucleotide-binding domain-containing protein [Desulfobacterales bacterium]
MAGSKLRIKFEKSPDSKEIAASLEKIFSGHEEEVHDSKCSQYIGFARDIFIPLVWSLDNSLDSKNKDLIAEHFARSVAVKDDDAVITVLIQKIESEFGQKLFDHLINKMDDAKFESVVFGIKHICDSFRNSSSGTLQNIAGENGDWKPDEIEAVKNVYRKIMESDKGKRIRIAVKIREVNEKLEEKNELAVLKSGISSILKGEKQAFGNKIIMRRLSSAVEKFFDQNQHNIAEALIEKLGEALMSDEPEVRAEISVVLSEISDRLISDQRIDIMWKLSYKITNWIKLEISMAPAYEKLCFMLQELARTLILNQQFAECNHILETFNLISSGILAKNDEINMLAESMLKNIATDNVLNPLLEEFQTGSDRDRKKASFRLVQLGAASADRLLSMLRESQDRYERVRLLRVVSDIGHLALPALTIQVNKGGPWYYIRNLVLLFGKIGDESHLETLRPFLEYGDLRVQRETLNSIFSIGGRKSEEIILSILPVADERLKADIVDMLSIMANHEAVGPLTELLESETIKTLKTGNDLAEKICAALGSIGSYGAVPALNRILEKKKSSYFDERVKAAAGSALAMIKVKDVGAAELSETQVYENGISREKADYVDEDYLSAWSELYSKLTPEETKALFGSLKERTYEAGRLIYKQGRPNSNLYFIEKGQLVLAYDQEGEKIWIKTLRPGDIAGIDGFFENSVCTTSMGTISDVKLKFLGKSVKEKWKNEFPDLESKLREYCLETDNVKDLLQEYGMERRASERFNISGAISVNMLDRSGNPDGNPVRANISNISAGGLSFFLRMPKENANQLKDRKLNMKFIITADKSHHEIDQNGTVVAVYYQISGNYSVHVKFEKTLAPFNHVYSLISSEKAKTKVPNGKKPFVADDFLKTIW